MKRFTLFGIQIALVLLVVLALPGLAHAQGPIINPIVTIKLFCAEGQVVCDHEVIQLAEGVSLWHGS